MSYENSSFFKHPADDVEKSVSQHELDEAIIANVVKNQEPLAMSEPARTIPKEIDKGQPLHKPFLEPRPPVLPNETIPDISPYSTYPKPPPRTL